MSQPATKDDIDRIEAFIGIHDVGKEGTVRPIERLRFERLLVAHDGSERAERALEWAIWLAKRFGSAVDIVAVVAPPPYLYDAGIGADQEVVAVRSYRHIAEREEAAARLVVEEASSKVIEACGEGPVVTTHVVHGAPAYTIAKLAKEIDADLILLGSHGHNAIERFILGSITDSVNDKADRSILIARTSPPKEDATILTASDGSRGGRRALAAAWDLAKQTGSKLDVGHVIEPPHIQHPEHGASYYMDLQTFCRERKAEGDALQFEGDVDISVLFGRAGVALVDHARKTKPGLIVLGSRGLGHLMTIVMGSVARRVAHAADQTVIVVKEAVERKGD